LPATAQGCARLRLPWHQRKGAYKAWSSTDLLACQRQPCGCARPQATAPPCWASGSAATTVGASTRLSYGDRRHSRHPVRNMDPNRPGIYLPTADPCGFPQEMPRVALLTLPSSPLPLWGRRDCSSSHLAWGGCLCMPAASTSGHDAAGKTRMWRQIQRQLLCLEAVPRRHAV